MAEPGPSAQQRPPWSIIGAPIWHRRMWAVALPIMIANATTPLLGMVDTAVVGHLGDPVYIGAVGAGAVLFSLVFWGFGFLRMGTTGLIAQARGADDRDRLRTVLGQAGLLALFLGLLLIAVSQPLRELALSLIDVSDAVADEARGYFDMRILGAPATLLNYVLMGWFLGINRAGLVLVTQLFLNLTNIVLSVLFVVGFGWGVPGVAIASAVAEYLALILGVVLVARSLSFLGGHLRWRQVFNTRTIKRLLAVNLDIFIRTLCLQAAFLWFTSVGGSLGNLVLAANVVLLQFHTLNAFILDGYAFACETLIGDRVGAGDTRGLRQAVRAATFWAALTAVVLAGFFWLAGDGIIALMTDLETVRAAAGSYLPWAVALPIVSVWSYLLDGIFVGATRTAAMRNSMIVSLIGFIALQQIFTPIWDNDGLWLAMLGFMALRAVTLGSAYPALLQTVTRRCQAA
ncbi:MAG: MATE family efflux transporter [Pseudomonadota bacterium]